MAQHHIDFIDIRAQLQRIRPQIDARIASILDRGAFILGAEVQELERQLATYTQAHHVITCANGTDAILIPLMAQGIGPGDAVCIPAFTFFATAEVVSLVGATPVFVDIDPHTYTMSAASLEEQIISTQKKSPHLTIRAVIPVDLFGLTADYEAIGKIAEKYNLTVIEDAAQGFGGMFFGKRAGNLAPIASTSFFPAKPLGCYGDGGAIFCKEESFAEVIRSIRVHGQGKHKYQNVRIGLNSRLDTIQAAILIEKLAIFDSELSARNKVANRYTDAFAELMQTPYIPEGYYSSWAQYTLRSSKRDAMITTLKEQGVPTMVYYPIPLHLQKAYDHLGYQKGSLPHAEQAAEEVISLPMHPYLSEDTQDYIIKCVISFLKENPNASVSSGATILQR
jgi:UDP-2-acetamido-2-deoxy-ribo-hexuluronate aminotransferase